MLSEAKRLRGICWEPFGTFLEPLQSSLRTSRRLLAASCEPLGSLLGASWEPLGGLSEALGGFLESFGAHQGILEDSGRLFWIILGTGGRILGPLGAFLGALGRLLGDT